MRRALAVAVLTLLAVVWAANAAVQTAWVQARIRTEVRALVYDLLNMTVDWDALVVHPLRLQVELQGFKAYSAAFTDTTPFLQSPRVTASVSFTGLLNRTIDIDPIVVERPIIRFGNDGDRWVNFLDIDKIDALASSASGGAPGGWSAVIRRVRLADADIDFFVSSIDLRAHLTEFWAEGRFDELAKHDRIPIRAKRGHGLYRMFGRDTQIESVDAELAVEIIKGPWVDLVLERADLRASYPNATLHGSGRIVDIGRRHIFHVEGAGETELNFLNDILFDRPRLTGTASYNLRYDGDFEHFKVGGEVAADSFLWDDLAVDKLAARAEVTERGLKIYRAKLGLFDGTAALAGGLDFETLAFTAEGSAKSISTAALRRRFAGLPPLRGALSGEFSAAGGLSPEVTAAGRLRIEAPDFAFGWDGRTRIDVRAGELAADFDWDGAALSVEAGRLSTDRETVDFSGQYTAAGDGMDFTLSVQSGDLGVLRPLVGFDVAGWGTAEGRWTGTLGEPELEFNFLGRDLVFPWFRAESARGVIGINLDAVTLRDVEAAAAGGTATMAEGRITGLRGRPALDLRVTGQDVPLRPALDALLGDVVPIGGRFDGEFVLGGAVTAPTGYVRGRLREAVAWDEPLDLVEGEVGIERGNLALRDLEGRAGEGRVRTRGRVDFDAGTLDVELEGDHLALDRVAHLRGAALGGEGEARVRIFGEAASPSIDGTFAARGVTAYTVAVGDVRGAVSKRGPLVTAEAEGAAGSARVGFTTADGFPGYVTAAAPRLDLTPLVAGDVRGDVELFAGGGLAYEGPLADWSRGRGAFDLAAASFRQNRATLKTAAPARFAFDGGLIDVPPVRLEGSNTAGELSGRAWLDGRLDLRVTGGLELQFFTLFVDGLRSADGRLEIDGAVKGTFAAPRVNGSLKVRKARLQLADVNLLFENADLDAVFGDGQIVVERWQARVGAGSVNGGGVLTMDGFVPTNVSLFATLNEAEARIPQWLLVRANGRLELVGPIDDVVLRGDLDVVQATYAERIDWEALILRFRPREAPTAVAARRGFHVDLGLHSAGSIFVRNNLADVKLRGDLQVKGYPPDLGVYGNLQVAGGSIFFRENVFSVESGQINFTDADRVRPVLDLRAKTRVEEATGTGVRRFDDISLEASGPPDELQINLESSPPLSREDIISLLYIRRRASTEDIGGGETAGSEAVSLAFKLNDDLAGFQSEVQDYFGFENLVLEPAFTDAARSGTLKLRAEKVLRRNLKATLSTSLSSADLDFWLGYAVTDNMLLDFGWNSVEDVQDGSSNVGNFKIRPRLHFEFQ